MLTDLRSPVRRLAFLAATVLALGAQAAPPDNDAKVTSAGGRAALAAQAQATGRVKVIVTLNLRTPFRPAGYLPPAFAQDQRNAIGEAASQLMREMAGLQVSEVKRYADLPQVAMAVSSVELDRLLNSPTVQSVAEDELKRATLDLSVPRIGGAIMAAQGLNGAGVTVAILDTGVDKTHPFLTGAVVSEACYSTSSSGGGYTASSLCPGGAASSTATNSALPYGTGVCPAGECDHGTHVAGITAGRYNGSFTGVAPGASLIAVQIFSRVDSANYCGGKAYTPCALAFTSDILSGLQRVIDLHGSYNIASVNMSLGGGKFTAYCDSEPEKPAIDTLRSYNIATAIAAGNNGYTNALSSPGCISSAVSVGATDDADLVASYSNSASFLSMLAPGSSINSSIPGGQYAVYNGTSMATPHVAGAWALIRQARATAVVTDVYNALANTGVPILDTRNNITKRRIQVNLAAAALPFFPGNGKVGTFRDGWWHLDVNGNGLWDGATDKLISFGMAGDKAVVGDWNGDGRTKIGVYRDGLWYLDYNGNGQWDSGIDKIYAFGMPGDIPVVGDWNHDGRSKIGLYRQGAWILDYNGNGQWDDGSIDRYYSFGSATDLPVVGDWSGDGFTKIGVFRGGWWYLDYNGNGQWDNSTLDTVYSYGGIGDVPVVGDWNGNGVAKIGVFRSGAWYLDYLGTGTWNGMIADRALNFGAPGDTPLVGKSW